MSVEIPEKCIKVYQDNKEETEEVAKKAAVEFLSVKSIKVKKLPKKWTKKSLTITNRYIEDWHKNS